MSLVRNEQVKLTATYLNGLAIATFAVGGLAPLVALVSGTTQQTALTLILISSIICVSGSAALHLIAKRHLKGLRE